MELSKNLEQTLAQNGRSRNGQGQNECRADFFHSVLYRRLRMLNRRMLESGQNHSFQIIDRCIWNYQSSWMCGRDGKFECSHVRAHREPLDIEPGHCLKRKFHNEVKQSKLIQGEVQRRYDPEPFRPMGHAKLRQEDEHVSYKARVGFYFPVYNKLEGTVEVLRTLRRYYPEEPVYVMNDGGPYDFGPLCKSKRWD